MEIAVLVSLATLVFPQGSVEAPRHELVTGVEFTLRADSAGTAVLLLASGFALVWLADTERRPAETAALLLCLLGTALTALAGNTVLLFGGLEIANVGAFVLANGGATHAGIQQRAGFALNHGAAIFLLLAAIRIQGDAGTTDFLAIPAVRVQNGLAGYWAIAGAVRVLAPFGLPRHPDSWGSPAWAAVGAVPAGGMVLLRDVEVTQGVMPAQVVVNLALLGVLAGAVAVTFAIRDHRTPELAGRWLCVAAAAPLIVLTGLPTPAALPAFALALLAAMLATATAPAWLPPPEGAAHPGGVRAAALLACGAVPVGAGFVAMFAATAAAASLGAGGAAIAVGMFAVWAGSAVAGVLAARAALRSLPAPAPLRVPRWCWPAVAAIPVSVAAATLPGLAVAWFAAPVGGGGGPGLAAVDAAAVRGPGGGWAGGYLLLAALLTGAAAWSASVLLRGRGVSRRRAAPAAPLPAPLALERRALAAVERAPGGLAVAERALDRVDSWLVTQPNLVTAVIAAVACLYLFR